MMALAVSVSGAAWAALAAEPLQQQPPPPRPPVFRAGSVLVTVDVYPQRDGKIVEGLTSEDFQVSEDGKPQVIDGVELVRIERSLDERRDPNSVTEMWALAAEPQNRVFVAYLDALHVSIDGSHNIRRPLVSMLDAVIAPNDLFGVMTTNMQARHLTLGRRIASVEEQLTKYWAWGERNRITPDQADPMEVTLQMCYSREPPWEVEDDGAIRPLDQVLIDRRREDRVLSSLEDLVTFLVNRREARTVLVLVSDGWRLFTPDRRLGEISGAGGINVPGTIGGGGVGLPQVGNTTLRSACSQELARLASLDNAHRFRTLLTQTSHANISVYPVTPSGLAVFDTPINLQTKTADPKRVGRLEIDANRLRNRISSLRTYAENTDGLAIVNTNDLDRGLRRIVDDVSSYYLLTYYSANTRNDGRYRRIEVTTKKPGLSMRHRRGYTAPTEAAVAARTAAAERASTASTAVDAVPVDAVFGPLSRLRAGAESFTYGIARATELLVAIELGSSQVFGGPFAKGADVRAVATLLTGGPAVGDAQGQIEPGMRGVLIRIPTPAGTTGPWQVTATVGGGADRIQERFEIRQATGKLLGDPMAFRATPAPTSPIRVVADFQYRRTERVHIEWPLLATVDRREARLVGRNGQALPLPVRLSERTDNGQTVIAADLTLAPLGPGDYAIELVVGQGANSERRYVAIRVGQ